jgi:photosystem II stability/assembly factor-like uncharacterized protein
LAYVGPGIGLVGACDAPDQEVPCHLYRTTDFAHFADATPPPELVGGGLQGGPGFVQAFFLDPEDGWVSTFHGGSAKVSIYRTTDGGSQWTAVQGTTHTENAGAASYVQFLSPTLGYLDTIEPTAPDAELAQTTDGGASWNRVATSNAQMSGGLPLAEVVFLDNRDAIATNDDPADCIHSGRSNVWVSFDGGVDWQTVALPPPAAPTAGTSVCPGVPTVSGTGVVMSADVIGPATASVVFLTSSDHGQSWHPVPGPPVSFTDSSTVDGTERAADPSGAVAADGSWWVMGETPTGGYAVATSADGGARWSVDVPRGLPPSGVLQPIVPIDRYRAWAVIGSGPDTLLFATSDGGATWHQELLPTP